MRRTLIIALLVLAVSLAACLAGAGYAGRSVAAADGLRAQAERADEIVKRVRSVSPRTGAPIDEVLAQESDLVKILTKLHPIAVIKG